MLVTWRHEHKTTVVIIDNLSLDPSRKRIRAGENLLEVGADSEYHVAIKSSSAGDVQSGKISISAQKGVRLSLDVELGESFNGAMKVVAHEV